MIRIKFEDIQDEILEALRLRNNSGFMDLGKCTLMPIIYDFIVQDSIGEPSISKNCSYRSQSFVCLREELTDRVHFFPLWSLLDERKYL